MFFYCFNYAKVRMPTSTIPHQLYMDVLPFSTHFTVLQGTGVTVSVSDNMCFSEFSANDYTHAQPQAVWPIKRQYSIIFNEKHGKYCDIDIPDYGPITLIANLASKAWLNFIFDDFSFNLCQSGWYCDHSHRVYHSAGTYPGYGPVYRNVPW